MQRYYSIPLRVWLPVIILAAFTLMLVASSMWRYQHQMAQLEQQTNEQIKELMTNLERRIETFLPLHQNELISEEIADLGNNLDINALALVDEQGQVLYATKRLWLGKSMAATMPEFDAKMFAEAQRNRRLQLHFELLHNHILAYQPIALAARAGEIRPSHIGMLLLDYSLASATTAIQNALWLDAIINLLISLISMLLLMFALHRWLSSPLNYLRVAVKRISQGDFKSPVEISGSGALAELGAAVNKMQVDLADAQSQVMHSIELLRTREKELKRITDVLPGPVSRFDVTSCYLFASAAYQQWFGLVPEKIIGKTHADILGKELYAVYEPHIRHAIAGATDVFETSIPNPDGGMRDAMITVLPDVESDGRVSGYYTICVDITELNRAKEKIHRLAFYDALTLLPNRRLLTDRLRHAMAAGSRDWKYAALLFIDLDNFKAINDTQGHKVGDLLLIEVARRILDCVRDIDTVARLGGDEFVVLVEGLSENKEQAAEQAMLVGEKIREAASRPYNLEGLEYHSSASIGISLFCGDTVNSDNLFKYADTALYQAKDAGRNALRFFDPQMQIEMEARALLETDLRHALSLQQFRLYYQMQVNAQGAVVGAEALLRWLHPEQGLVSPLKFIPIAESTGLIVSIGAWVLHTACAQIKIWQADPHTAHLQLAVNVSARQFRQSDFVEQVLAVVKTSGIDAHLLKLELTESLVLDNIEKSIATMQALRDMGIRFSMDDFGTGQSSLTYLRRLPLDQLKIDQSFVRDISRDEGGAAIVKTIIVLAQNLGMEVIAEGVETTQQQEFLEQNGCYLHQGYLFGKPVPIEDFVKLH